MKIEVHLQGGIRKIIDIDVSATNGATVGKNLYWPDGSIVTQADLTAAAGGDVTITAWSLILDIPPNVAALADTTTTGLYVVTGDGTSETREIQGTSSQIDVANGDGVAGDPAVSLSNLADAGGGSFKLLTRDTKGRLSGTSDGDTDDVPEGGANLYFTAARVRATALTGLSVATNAAITAADTVLSGMGKLQAQITATIASLANYVLKTRVVGTGSGLTGGGDLTADRTIALNAGSIASLVKADSAVQSVVAGANVTVDNTDPRNPVVASTGGGGGGGTVTSVALSVPAGLSVAGSPVTTSGTFTVTYAAGYVGYTTAEQTKLSGIASGATANTGTVTSVGAIGSTGLAVSGSPITTSGSITYTLSTNLQSWSGIAPTSKADLASPAFTGTPTAPTASAATNTTQVATTAYVKSQGYSTTTGTVTSVAAGNGMTFTTITGAGSVTMGTPGTLTGSTTNAVTTNSHTHALSANLSALDAYAPSAGAVANTLALRTVSGDICARLFRSTYANQSAISGAMAYRINNSGDEYIRFCSSPAAVNGWLGSEYVTLTDFDGVVSAGTFISGSSTTTNSPVAGRFYSGVNVGRSSTAGAQIVARETAGTSELWWRGYSASSHSPWLQAAALDTSVSFTDVTATGTITAGNDITAVQDFKSSTAIVILAPTGAGTVYLRSNGTGSEFKLTSDGNITTKGTISDIQGNVRSAPAATSNASVTVASTALNGILEKTNTTAYNYTISTTLGAAATRGDMITFVNSGTAGNITVVQGASTTIVKNGVSGSFTVGPGSMATIVYSATANKWIAG